MAKSSPGTAKVNIEFDGRKATGEVAKFTQSLQRLGAISKETRAGIDTLAHSTQALTGAFAAVSASARKMAELGGFIIKANSDFENLKSSLTGLISVSHSNIDTMGRLLNIQQKWILSTKKADETLQSLNKIASKTSFSLEQTSQMFKAFYSTAGSNLSLEQSIEAFEGLANMASVVGINVEQMIRTLDGVGAGKWTSSELTRFLEGNLGLTKELAQEAIKSGRYYELLMSKLSEFSKMSQFTSGSYEASVASLKNEFNQLAQVLGQPIFESLKEGLKDTAKFLNENRDGIVKFVDVTQEVIRVLGALGASYVTVNLSQKAFDKMNKAIASSALLSNTALTRKTQALGLLSVGLDRAKIAAMGLGAAFKSFLPTAALFVGFELLIKLLGSSEEKMTKLGEAATKTAEEIRKLTQAEQKLELINQSKNYSRLQGEIENKEAELNVLRTRLKYAKLNRIETENYNKQLVEAEVKLEKLQKSQQQVSSYISDLNQALYENANSSMGDLSQRAKEIENIYEGLEKNLSNIITPTKLKEQLAELDAYIAQGSGKMLEAAKIERERIAKQLGDMNKKGIKDATDYNNAIKQISQIGLSEYEKKLADIVELERKWIDAGVPKAKAKEAAERLKDLLDTQTANDALKEYANFLKEKETLLQEYYLTIGEYEKAWAIESKKLKEKFAPLGLTEEEAKKYLEIQKKKFFEPLAKVAKNSFKDIKGSWADTVSTMQKTVEEGFFDFFMQKTKSLKGALKEIGQGVFRDFISPYARSLSQGLSGGFGALLGGGSNLASIASFYGLTKNAEGGFSGQVNGTDVVISGTGEILSGNSAFGGAGNILSAVSNLKSIYSMFSGGYSGLVSNFTTAPAGYLSSYLSSAGYTGASFGIQGLGAGAQHALTGNLIAGGGLNGTLSGAYGAGYIGGAALAGAGVGYGIGTLGDKLFKADTKAGTYGAIGGALGGAASAGLLGAQIGAFMGPFGMLIGAALGAIIGGMIGKWKTTDTGLFLDKGIAASLGQSTILSDVKRFEDQQKKTWFSKKDKTNFSDIDEETLKALNSAFAATKHVLKGISATDHLYLREGKFSGNDFFNQNLAGAAISAFTGQLGKDSTHKSFAALADKEKKEIYEVILSTLGTVKQAVTEIDFIGIKNPIVSAAKVVENSIDTFKISTDGAFGEFSNILSISTDKFKEKYLNALRNDFTKENVDKWNAAKQAYEAARKAQEDYTKAVISFTQQIAGIQSGFYGANKIDTTFLGLQSIYRRFNTLLGGLNYDINDNQRKEVAKFGSATDIHSWSKYLLSLSSDQMQAFLSEGNTELRQELVKVLTEHKQAIDANGGKEGWIKSLVELEALNKQIAGLKLAEQAEKTLQLQREQLNVLNLQKSVIEKLGSIAQRVRDSVIDHKTSGINYQFALERARVAWNNKDYSSKAFDNLSNAANHQQQYFKDTAKTYEEYKLNMLKMAGEIEAISDRTTLDDINKSIKKLEDLLNIGNKTIENQLTALEMQRQQLIQNSQSQIEAMDKLLGDNSSWVKYLKDVLDKLTNKDIPKDAPKTQIPNYSSGVGTTNNKFRTANGALLLTKLDEQINQTYLSSLGRSVEQSGLEFWRNKINAGQMSITQLAGELIKSAIAITGSNNKSDWIEWYKSKGFKPFADGGIVTRPTAALIGEAGYPEAVLPLDGRTLKVDTDNKELERLLREVIYLLKTQGKDMKELNLSFQNVTDGDKLFTKAM